MTRIYIVRHAEAEGNIYRRAHGWYDSLITENGYRQIAALRQRFAGEHIDAVYSSDLFRTRTTAGAVCAPRGMEPVERRSLREIGFGDWEDRTWGDMERADGARLALFYQSSSDWRAPGGESFAEVMERMRHTVYQIAHAHPGQTVAVFSHGSAIRCLQGALRDMAPEDMRGLGQCDNTGVTCVEVGYERHNIVFENDNAHLPEEISTLAHQHWWKSDPKKYDVNLWFRPLDMEGESGVYFDARKDAWQDIHGSLRNFDGAGFLDDARRCRDYDHRAVVCALRGERIAGVLQLDLERDADQGVGYIPFVYMLPDSRRQGLGVQLLGQAVSTYRSLGRQYLRLRCAPDNEVAQRFYRRYGFRKIGQAEGARVPLDLLEKYIGYDPEEIEKRR